MPTKLIKLSPAFLASLERVAPKKRRGRIRYLIALALLVVVAFIGADPFARDLLSTKTRAAVTAMRKSQPSTQAQAKQVQPVAPVKTFDVITVPTIVIGTDAGGESAAPTTPSSPPVKAKRAPRAAKALSRHAAAIVAARIPADI